MSPRTVVAGVLRRRPFGGSAQSEPVSALEAREGRASRGWRTAPDDTPPHGLALGSDAVRAPLTPLAVRPRASRHEAGRMLMSAIEGLELDWVDRSLLVRADAVWDPADMVILASLLERARQAGPAATPTVAPVGPGWVMTCADCGLRGIGDPATLPEAESLCRTHDIVHHGGAWTARPVEVVGSTR